MLPLGGYEMKWTEIGGIPSESSRNRRYSLEASEEGELRCSCQAFRYSEDPKTCKHVESQTARELLQAWLSTRRAVPRIARHQGPSSWLAGGRFLFSHSVVAEVDVLNAEAALRAARQAWANPSNLSFMWRLDEALRKVGY